MSSKEQLPIKTHCIECDNVLPPAKDWRSRRREYCSKRCQSKAAMRRELIAKPEQVKQRRRNFRQNNPESVRNSEYKKRYGITLAEYNVLNEKQKGLCAICNKPGKLVIDHCHATGTVRGLLHANCNAAIGLLQDSVEIATLAASYLATKGVA